jgi:hypothetical protein
MSRQTRLRKRTGPRQISTRESPKTFRKSPCSLVMVDLRRMRVETQYAAKPTGVTMTGAIVRVRTDRLADVLTIALVPAMGGTGIHPAAMAGRVSLNAAFIPMFHIAARMTATHRAIFPPDMGQTT